RNAKNFLYHNDGGTNFTKITSGRIVNDIADGEGCAWADYDNDGNPDLFVCNWRNTKNFLYHNNADGTFTRVTNSSAGGIVTENSDSIDCAWGDYDNDGFLDLFVANAFGEKKFLYHNNGNGTFTKITNSPVTLDVGNAPGCAWGDYDNDS